VVIVPRLDDERALAVHEVVEMLFKGA